MGRERLTEAERKEFEDLIERATWQGNYELDMKKRSRCHELIQKARESGDEVFARNSQSIRNFLQRYGEIQAGKTPSGLSR